jgi:hypothetical protein
MDIAMPGASGVEAVRHIRQWDRNARILIFSMHLSAAMTLKAFEAGASGFVTKSSGLAELIRAVSAVASGGRALSPDVAEALAADRLASSSQIVGDLSLRRSPISSASALRRSAITTMRSRPRSGRATTPTWCGSPPALVSSRSMLQDRTLPAIEPLHRFGTSGSGKMPGPTGLPALNRSLRDA